jgi:hypothetical protein
MPLRVLVSLIEKSTVTALVIALPEADPSVHSGLEASA